MERRGRRVGSGIGPGRWGILPSRPGRGTRHIDDREGTGGRILQQPRLARGRGGRGGVDRSAGSADPRRAEIFRARAPGVVQTRAGACFRIGALALGFAFLYAPIVLLGLYSFYGSRLGTPWGRV